MPPPQKARSPDRVCRPPATEQRQRYTSTDPGRRSSDLLASQRLSSDDGVVSSGLGDYLSAEQSPKTTNHTTPFGPGDQAVDLHLALTPSGR